MSSIVDIKNLNKAYDNGFKALENADLTIRQGEIFALLGPNGAGKTTLINIVCGIVKPTQGTVVVGGYDIIKDFRQTRSLIGLVPQELTTDAFETVWDTVCFSRRLFNKPFSAKRIEEILKALSLWDKRKNIIRTLSGGMKRRVMIAKALSHDPQVLFLDEPTAGVDVELRRDMWNMVRQLKATGVTIILTTHYIEEAEEMADRIGVINGGKIIVVAEKVDLMNQLGRKELILELNESLASIPEELAKWSLTLSEDQHQLVYTYNAMREENGIAALLNDLSLAGIAYHDIHTQQSSLEDIFIELVKA